MRSIISLTALTLGAGAVSAPALAQYATPPASYAPVAPATVGAAPLCHANVSKEARKALVDLQIAVIAKDAANIPARVAAAQALAKTPDDKCFIGLMQQQAAVDRGDLKGLSAAIEAQLGSGVVPSTRIAMLYENLGRMQFNARAYSDAAATFERALQIAPTAASAVVMLAETRVKQNRVADALPLYKKAIALESAAGRKADQNWYKRSVSAAYDAKSPLAFGLARDWIAAYPSAQNWRDAIRIHAALSGLDNAGLIDMYRLARINRALAGEADYGRYAQVALAKGFAGEAKAMLEEGFAANAIDRNSAVFKPLYAEATTKAAGDRAALGGQAKTAQAGTAVKPLMALGEAYFGYGDYAQAATMFRAAQAKTGVDAELANLRLGMALAASGDKPGAKAALDLVTGSRAEIARYWLAYLAARP
ncbi:MAG: hypothetical protein LH465_01520 [Sphingomonas bacterium]|nr:hypothetical protein [Sphingomonas bacterium]